MQENVLLIHGGAPTAVLNASLYGSVVELKRANIGNIMAARGGSGAALQENFINMRAISDAHLALLPHTPGSAIGTSRHVLEAQDYANLAKICVKHQFSMVLFSGGNGSMDACGKLAAACRHIGHNHIRVVGVSKTIDNDIAVTDHAPGFASAARAIAGTTAEVAADVKSLPIHISVIEAMGRNAGWLTAASALARESDFAGDAGPHLLLFPEVPFDEDAFLGEVQRLRGLYGGVVVVASEGLRGKNGKPVVPPIFQVGRSVYYGDVSAHLANLVIQKLGMKARSEKPGIINRASIAFQSPLDCEEAIQTGVVAARAALEGKSEVMAGFRRLPGQNYACEPVLIPIAEVMLKESLLPAEFIQMRPSGLPDVTPAFLEWCRPLLGGPLPSFVNFNNHNETDKMP